MKREMEQETILKTQLKKINAHFCENENLTRKDYEKMSVDFFADMIVNGYVRSPSAK